MAFEFNEVVHTGSWLNRLNIVLTENEVELFNKGDFFEVKPLVVGMLFKYETGDWVGNYMESTKTMVKEYNMKEYLNNELESPMPNYGIGYDKKFIENDYHKWKKTSVYY